MEVEACWRHLKAKEAEGVVCERLNAELVTKLEVEGEEQCADLSSSCLGAMVEALYVSPEWVVMEEVRVTQDLCSVAVEVVRPGAVLVHLASLEVMGVARK